MKMFPGSLSELYDKARSLIAAPRPAPAPPGHPRHRAAGATAGTCQSGGVPLKTPQEIEQMRPVGRLVADVLTSLREHAKIGMTTWDLDAHAAEMIAAAGAR